MLSITSTDFSIANQPNGITELTHRVYYSSELSGFLEEINGELTFHGADYTFLRRAYLTNSCNIIPFEISDGCGLVLDCNMFLNECEWRPDLCQVKGQLVDAGFLSLIDQNMGIKAYVNVGRSKNDVDISSSVLEQTNLYYYGQNQQGGGGDIAAQNRVGVRVYDAFKMLVAFMTDGALGFESDFFRPDDLGRGYYTLITGNSLRTGDINSWPYISFEELYKDCQRLFNLSFTTETVGGVKRLRIEPTSFFRQTNNSITLADPDAVFQTSNEKSFYQKVEFGSNEFDNDDYTYFPKVAFLGARKEEYHLGGQCNTNNVLKLRTEVLITDTNRIQAALPVASGGAADPSNITDEDTYLILHYSDNSVANYPNPLFPTTLVYFNELLTNFQTALRWGDGIPNSIYLFLGSGLNGAQGVTLSNYVPSYQTLSGISAAAYLSFPFDTFPNGYDPNGNFVQSTDNLLLGGTPPVIWTLGQSMFVAPIDGIYTAQVRLLMANFDSQAFHNLFISRFDTVVSGNIVSLQNGDIPELGNLNLQNGVWVWEGSFTFNLLQDERLAVFFQISQSPVTILAGSSFTVGSNFTISQTYNPQDANLIDTAIKYPITSQTWQTYLNNRHGIISVPFNNGAIQGRTNDLSRNLHTGMTEVKIVSTFGQTEI
jgi:hypothetical protein